MTALTQHYTYSSDGKLQTETLPSGAVIGYQYNQDQLSALSINGQTYLSGLSYNAAQQITRWQWADGSANQQVYDNLNRLQRFQLGKDTRTLSYDAVSNVIGFEDQGANPQSQRFGYDMLDRIISYQAANDTQTFEYDPNGNRTAKRQQNNLIPYLIEANSNRLMGIGNAAQQLDANGNLLNDGKYLYTYNAQNRLANVDGIYRYTYNANQQRVQKTTPQGTTLYAWANSRIIGEYDQSGTAKQETVYMGTTPIATIQQGRIYRIYADQLDTPRVITDENGKTLWRWDSSPFGETAANEDADGDGIALNYNPRFPGQLYDAETGLHYNYHRDYNPETGRYVQSDPIGLAGGLNTFGYAYQSPYWYVDPDGKMGQILGACAAGSTLGSIGCGAAAAVVGIGSWLLYNTAHNALESLRTATESATESVNEESVTSYRAPHPYEVAGVLAEGFSLNNGSFFSLDPKAAGEYAYNYRAGLFVVTTQKSVMEDLFARGLLKIDPFVVAAYSIQPGGYTEFNAASIIKYYSPTSWELYDLLGHY